MTNKAKFSQPLGDFPFKIRYKRRCSFLNEDGGQCLGKATYLDAIHQDSEQPGGDLWFVVYLCERHLEK